MFVPWRTVLSGASKLTLMPMTVMYQWAISTLDLVRVPVVAKDLASPRNFGFGFADLAVAADLLFLLFAAFLEIRAISILH
jgi:hypothetical protein